MAKHLSKKMYSKALKEALMDKAKSGVSVPKTSAAIKQAPCRFDGTHSRGSVLPSTVQSPLFSGRVTRSQSQNGGAVIQSRQQHLKEPTPVRNEKATTHVRRSTRLSKKEKK